MRWLLDTSIYSQPLKRKPVTTILRRWAQEGDQDCVICDVVRAEVEWGLHRENLDRRWVTYRRDLQSRLPVLPILPAIWSRYAVMRARQDALGRPIGDLDLLIAATAVEHDLILATINTRHFSQIEGLRWANWSY